MKSLSKEKLTAYALEELSATERAEFEALLATSPEDQEYAGETREFCQLLQASIGGNAAPAGLTAAQKEAIAKTIPFAANPSPRKHWPVYAFGTAAAAAVAVWLAMPYFNSPEADMVAMEKMNLPTANNSNHAGFTSGPAPSIPADRMKLDLSKEVTSEVSAPESPAGDRVQGPVSEPLLASKAKSESEGDSDNLSDALAQASADGTKEPKKMSAPSSELSSASKVAQLDLYSVDDASASATPNLRSLSSGTTPIGRGEGGLAGRGRGGAYGDGFGKGAAPAKPATAAASLARAGESDFEGAEARHYRYLGFQPETEPLAQQSDARTDESYIAPAENPYRSVAAEPLSTFSIDVDTASYANVRRFLNMGQRPPAEAVRLEELVNYFRYDYPAPAEGKPCSITADLVSCPWNENHRLARVGLKARTDEKRPNANLVFLLDVSGSMNEPNKLPLVKKSLHLLVDKLTENDRVSIVVYAGASGLVLPPTHGENKKAIFGAIDNLQPGGSTNGASGITLAYEEARKGFIKEGVNRVILATDGDFNVGISDREGLQSLIENEAKSGVFLSVLGYGMGNLKDSTMEVLADKGNGNYAYIDSLGEARKVLAEEMSSTLVTVAKDVKVQIEFNPAKVRSYRLLGYENRMLAKEDFNNDKKDAGEMGAGHTVTALYEIVPVDAPLEVPAVDGLKYQPPVATTPEAKPVANDSPESMTVKVRYKAPDADVSQLMELPVTDQKKPMTEASGDTKFATAVAGYAMLLKGSNQGGSLNWAMIRQLAKAGKGTDAEGYRGEFMGLVDKAEGLVR